jgi:hypothetical protein
MGRKVILPFSMAGIARFAGALPTRTDDRAAIFKPCQTMKCTHLTSRSQTDFAASQSTTSIRNLRAIARLKATALDHIFPTQSPLGERPYS